MADLGLMDIVALAKAGYKKKDIDAILASKGDDTPAQQETPDIESKDLTEGNKPTNDPAPDPDTSEGNGDEKPAPDDTDYKKLYEDLQKSSADMQSQIKELQTKINSQDNSNSAANDSSMDDLMNSFKNFS